MTQEEQQEQYVHDLICNISTDITSVKRESQNLKEIVDGLETYTDNILLVRNLRHLSNRLEQLSNKVDSNFDTFVLETAPKAE